LDGAGVVGARAKAFHSNERSKEAAKYRAFHGAASDHRVRDYRTERAEARSSWLFASERMV
jgi:hypothetical protein